MMDDITKTFSWSSFYALRKAVCRAYPSVYNLRLKKKILDIVIDELKDGDRILDVGASDGMLGQKIRRRFPSIIYKTMDIDVSRSHDYYDLADISESFDLIILSEVIEHLPFNDGIAMLSRLFCLLDKKGRLVVSTPNIHNPNRYWWDPDHKTPYRYDVIGAALLSAGFDIKNLFRIYNDQFIRRFFRIHVASYIHRYFDIDFAKSIIAVAEKK